MRVATYALATFLAFASQSALGALVRVDFAGSVATISGQIFQDAGEPLPVSPADAEVALGGSIHVGTPFSGFFVYDDSAIPTQTLPESTGGPAFASYDFPIAPGAGLLFAAHAEIGSFARDGAGAHVEVYDNELYLNNPFPASQPSTLFFDASLNGPSVPGSGIALSLLQLYAVGGSAGSPLHGTSLNSIPWEGFPNHSANLFFQDGDLQVIAGGVLTELVPEPAGVSLVAFGACAVVAAMRRVRARS